MSSRNLYLIILFFACVVLLSSFNAGEPNFKFQLSSSVDKYEFFALFLYFSVVFTILNSTNVEKSRQKPKNERRDQLNPIFSISPEIIIFLISFPVLTTVLMTS